MAQVCLLDSARLKELLEDALSWNSSVASLMVSATNGSILAYAYRDSTPSIKQLRTQSTTMTAAYTVSSEDVLVFEAQDSRAISVIAPVADHILLGVCGNEVSKSEHERASHDYDNDNEASEDHEQNDTFPIGEGQAQEREQLEVVSQDLATILKEELAGLKWPEDI